mgnify:CR=1 FL=1
MSGKGSDADTDDVRTEALPTAILVLADGTVLEGCGRVATGHAEGEGCLNTALTGD